MARSAKIICLVAIIALSPGLANLSFSESLPLKAEDYPSLSEKELGHIQFLVKVALQPPGDWSYMGGREEGQEGLEAFRYQLGYMAYVLAVAQYHKTPAYRELYKNALNICIQKMIRKDVWYYWEETSKGFTYSDPPQKGRGLGWIDPVVEKNIMYSGHLINMLELYHMLYRDDRYDRPESITFRWNLINKLRNVFQYDGNKLAKVIHKQFMENPLHMIECEVGFLFPVCNSHPLVGLMLYDHNHGTNLAGPVKELLMKTFNEKSLLDPVTRDFQQLFIIEQGIAVGPPSPANNAFVGIPLNAWNPKLAEELYPIHAKQVKYASDGTATVEDDKFLGNCSMPAFAGYAKEMGDEKTARSLIAWMEKNCSPKWVGNGYYYPRNDEKRINVIFNWHAAFAELNVQNGIRSIYNQPFDDNHFSQPYISSVEYPKAIVQQAYYDNDKDVLAVTLLPGEEKMSDTSFAVNQLDRAKDYSIVKNGEFAGRLKKGVFEPASGAKGIEYTREGILKISTGLDKAQTFLIQGEI